MTRTRTEKLELAGLALRNGVLVIGPHWWGVAVRSADGELGVSTGSVRRAPSALTSVPIMRGVVRLAEMFTTVARMRAARGDARLAWEHIPTMAIALAVMALPALLRRRGVAPVWIDACVGVANLGAGIMLARGGALARYHGAEHMAIGAYERGIPTREATREHDRCGTHLLVPGLALSTLATMALRRHAATRGSANSLGSLIGMGLAVELARRGRARHLAGQRSGIAHLGHWLQTNITTAPPDALQIEVADAALAAVIAAENTTARATATSRGQ